MSISRLTAEDRFAAMKKRDLDIRQGLDSTTTLRLEKIAKLRELRLAKEAQDEAEKQASKDIKAAGKDAFKKARTSA